MNIKKKITIGFGLLVATILLLFSLFIFEGYESYRRSLMRMRLQKRALAAQAYFHNRNEFQQSSYLFLPEQEELIYDADFKLLYSSLTKGGYIPSKELLKEALHDEVYFTYSSGTWEYPKEGVARSFSYHHQKYVAVVMAYDLTGRQTSRNLFAILIGGNLLALAVIVAVGFFFSHRAMAPFDQLIAQINTATVNDFSFRLVYKSSSPDEATYLADSFNQLLARLQKLARSHEHFIGYASHEIRTPLTVVKGMLETSLAYDSTLETTRESIEKALYRLEGAIELANSLLQLTEVEGLNSNQLLEDINLVDTVFDTVGYFQEKYPLQKINLQFTDTFTESSSAVKVIGNTILLRTALINIIDNACKYSDFRPVQVEVRYQPKWVVIDVIDYGIGIPSEQLSQVFLPMMRAGNVGTVKGAGLGLTLAEKIVGIHQGYLQIHSIAEKGTTVSIGLPALLLDSK